MKRSRSIALVLSGALVSGLGPVACYKPEPFVPQPDPGKTATLPDTDEPKDQDNNSYTPGVGYYHSPFHAWYPTAVQL